VNTLIEGLALGHNPRETAREMRDALGGDLARALKISRTETLRAYRESTRRSYEENRDLIVGWYWMAGKDARTCAACLAMDGTLHKLDEPLDDHPNGRCTMIPALDPSLGIKGAPRGGQLTWQAGSDWFAEQDEETQRKVLGDAGYDAYQAGAIELSSLVGQSESKVWGTTRRVVGLQEATEQIVGDIGEIRTIAKLGKHVEDHGELLGVADVAGYLEKLKEHVNKPGLSYYTVRRSKEKDAMWYAIDMDTGNVVQYNESRKSAWSFYHCDDTEKLISRTGLRAVQRRGRT